MAMVIVYTLICCCMHRNLTEDLCTCMPISNADDSSPLHVHDRAAQLIEIGRHPLPPPCSGDPGQAGALSQGLLATA